MVKALHKAGIEVILDVVFNHTGEGNHEGPTISFQGLDNRVYYLLEPDDQQYYMDYSGCGNTVNCNHPDRRRSSSSTACTTGSREMHVDGFRFDLGVDPVTAAPDGAPMDDPPVLWHIELDDELADTKIIAEAWDAGGALPGRLLPGLPLGGVERPLPRRRPPVREGRPGPGRRRSRRASPAAPTSTRRDGELPDQQHQLHHLPRRLHAQRPRLLQRQAQRGQRRGQPRRHRRQPELELRRRRATTDDPAIEALRGRQIKNFAAILLLSQGVPMFVTGDEVAPHAAAATTTPTARTTRSAGSTGRWSSRTPTSSGSPAQMIAFRQPAPEPAPRYLVHGPDQRARPGRHPWHGCRLLRRAGTTRVAGPRVHARRLPGSGDDDGQSSDDVDIHVMINMEWQDLDFDVPTVARPALAPGHRHRGGARRGTSPSPGPAWLSPARRSASGTAAWWS